MIAIEVPFKAEDLDDKPKPLEMKHFYFPLGMWLVGILLSVFCLLAELFIHRLRKSKTDVPIEEPGVTQSTPELEVLHNNDVDIEDTEV